MIHRMGAVSVIAMVCAAAVVRADEPAAGMPPIFSATPLAEAIAKSRQTNGIVVADFTAEWCAPCKMMERTVFRDARVEKWAKDHSAVMIRIDTDVNAALRTEYAVSAWPTFIGFKNGEIIDRRLGSMTTDQFLTWLEKVDRAGKAAPGTETIVLPAPPVRAPETQDLSGLSINDRCDAVRALLHADKFEKATPEYLWLWRNMATEAPALARFRRTHFRGEISLLTESYAPAMEIFVRERDDVEKKLKLDDRTFDDLLDWIALNFAVGQEGRTLEWFDRVKSQPESGPTLLKAGDLLNNLLQRKKRWADLALTLADPVACVRSSHEHFLRAKPADAGDAKFRASVKESFRDLFHKDAAAIYLSQLAVGREDVAERVAAEAIKLDNTPETRIELVGAAAKAGLARKAQGAMLDEAEKAGADVKELRKTVAAAPK